MVQEESNIFGEKGCEKHMCPMNSGSMCVSPFGCMYYETDFLNSTIDNYSGEVTDDTFKNFIR